MAYYNIVLLPPDDLSQKIKNFAAANFADAADGYCLSDNVHPHVTLCHFEAHDKPVFKYLEGSVPIILASYSVRHGFNEHAGFLWPELTVYKTGSIITAQREAAVALGKNDLSSVTERGNLYWPHVTLCRIRPEKYKNISVMPDISFFNQSAPWSKAWGRSDANGQFLGVL